MAGPRTSHCSLLATFVVAAGVVIEGTEDIKDAWAELNRYRFKSNRKLKLTADGVPIFEHRLDWLKFVVLSGWLLIALGVVGEFWLEQHVSEFDRGIQAIDDELMGESRLQTALANERAESARSISKGFEASIEKSNTEAKIATARAASAEALTNKYESQIAESAARVTEAEARAEEARSMAEAEALVRAQIEQQLEWRTITPEQREAIRRIAATFPGIHIAIDHVAGDAEGGEYASEFVDALTNLWIVNGPNAGLFTGRLPEGVFIRVGNRANAPAVALQRALGPLGIKSPRRVRGEPRASRYRFNDWNQTPPSSESKMRVTSACHANENGKPKDMVSLPMLLP